MNDKLTELLDAVKEEYLAQVQIVIDNKECSTPKEYVKVTMAGKALEALNELVPKHPLVLEKAATDRYGDDFEVSLKEALVGIMGYSGTFFTIANHEQE